MSPQRPAIPVPPVRWGAARPQVAVAVQARPAGGPGAAAPPPQPPPVRWPQQQLQQPQAAQPFLAPILWLTAGAIGANALYQNYYRQPEVFENRQKAHWEDELETMQRDELERHKAGTLGFKEQIESRRPFIWVLDTRDRLYLMDGLKGDPKHSMAAKGRSLYSAGVGQWLDVNKDGKPVLTISNVTGHYHASYESLYRAVTAFKKAGYDVKPVVDRKGSAPRGYLWHAGRYLGWI